MTKPTAPADGGALPSENRIIHPDGQIVGRRDCADGFDRWFLTGEFAHD